MRFFIAGMIFKISSVSPEFEIAIKASSGVNIPRSPCKASPGWMKKLGVPVLAKVAAILAPIWPDLPIPLTMQRPLVFNIKFIA